ncbi:7-cyano-7-deazaguanine synthase QueC [bacterium]|nr:7-cyano-7-deazaguanine synthase QueC [candidate division CSSED10-310 bacterium]
MPLSIVLLSGGMDSCVTAGIASKTSRLACLHVTYGQRTKAKERKAFEDIASHYGAAYTLILDMPHFATIGGSSLTDLALPVRTTGIDETNIPDTYVPFRNGNLLAVAVTWAEQLHARYIYIGVNEMDSSGYPDCSASFIRAFSKAANTGTKPETHIIIKTPLIKLNKCQIVSKGMSLNVPFEKTWSCYQNEDVACGQCDSCRLRLKGFREAGFADPIPYHNLLKEKNVE